MSGDYGTGAVMINAFSPEIFSYEEVPGLVSEKELKQNREMDFTCVQKYNLPMKKIFHLSSSEKGLHGNFINSPLLNKCQTKEEAVQIINDYLEKENKGQGGQFYHLKD
ncbi:MAG: hypothetical protein NY202_05015 [Mollicutes bacterium UO1]